MRTFLALSALVAALALASPASAGDDPPAPDRRPVAADGPMSRPTVEESYVGEPCWGDRYEKDEDLNDGSRITTEEILRIINPVQS